MRVIEVVMVVVVKYRYLDNCLPVLMMVIVAERSLAVTG